MVHPSMEGGETFGVSILLCLPPMAFWRDYYVDNIL